MSDIDPDTGVGHIAPLGMEHHTRRQKGTGKWYATLKMRHFIIKEHQNAFPELAERMRDNPNNASNIYSAFIAMLPLKAKGRLTPDLKKSILKVFKVI